MPDGAIRIGCAGWAIPRAQAALFPGEGTHLQRYAGRFAAVEINSSFYRPHRPETYRRWAASVPQGFRFAVKLPREITHIRRLAAAEEPLDRFLAAVAGLGAGLGPLLVQLPPSLRFAADAAGGFFAALRQRFAGAVACEPRHASWFADAADRLLAGFAVARAAADPAVVPAAAVPGGWGGLVYYRWHGSPQRYHSAYAAPALDALAAALQGAAGAAPAWCIFDNTASGAAIPDALALRQRLEALRDPVP